MVDRAIDKDLLLVVKKISEILKLSYSTEYRQGSDFIKFQSGKILKKSLVIISYSHNLVGVDIYLDNVSEDKIKEIEHSLTHLKQLLNKKDTHLIINKIIL